MSPQATKYAPQSREVLVLRLTLCFVDVPVEDVENQVLSISLLAVSFAPTFHMREKWERSVELVLQE
jgi:hypothetical protein